MLHFLIEQMYLMSLSLDHVESNSNSNLPRILVVHVKPWRSAVCNVLDVVLLCGILGIMEMAAMLPGLSHTVKPAGNSVLLTSEHLGKNGKTHPLVYIPFSCENGCKWWYHHFQTSPCCLFVWLTVFWVFFLMVSLDFSCFHVFSGFGSGIFGMNWWVNLYRYRPHAGDKWVYLDTSNQSGAVTCAILVL